MAESSDPVSPDEFVLRRIPNVHDRVKDGLPIIVFWLAFRPESRDTDGISLYRSLFVTPDQVAENGPNPKGYFVARLKVSDILAIHGLSLQPTPQLGGNLPGHVSIPELNPARIKTKGPTKDRATDQMLELAKLASAGIVYRPNQ